MKTRSRILASIVGIALAIGAVQAQTVDQRHDDQQHRVNQGIRNGSLTPRETNRIEHQQGRIDRQEARMRSRDGGHLTRYDRNRLQHRENRTSRHIYRAKHNHRHY